MNEFETQFERYGAAALHLGARTERRAVRRWLNDQQPNGTADYQSGYMQAVENLRAWLKLRPARYRARKGGL